MRRAAVMTAAPAADEKNLRDRLLGRRLGRGFLVLVLLLVLILLGLLLVFLLLLLGHGGLVVTRTGRRLRGIDGQGERGGDQGGEDLLHGGGTMPWYVPVAQGDLMIRAHI